ncbi:MULTISPECIES: hypothetical protein [unclassified Paenibacillus]|uniref:hypothetical protein n=1 Tax=unclassified Paenibacillus TaxID=185978 RepID=UPI0007097592|nr:MULTISPECIES: hypothetical protein [unclassified Paenibacillus]KQX46060.1 hypothetical protein ASD40_19790 [Paenibacillus sp. Root444D2]KRE44755.1 hypothetical protein ASG85_32350 [Paenibacillus sp. Soil724D2]
MSLQSKLVISFAYPIERTVKQGVRIVDEMSKDVLENASNAQAVSDHATQATHISMDGNMDTIFNVVEKSASALLIMSPQRHRSSWHRWKKSQLP